MSARIVILSEPIDTALLAELAAEVFGDMVKFVVDVEREIVAVGGEMRVEAEALLLEDGSRQEHLWGDNFLPGEASESRVEYASLINIRPAQDSFGMFIQSEAVRRRVLEIVERWIVPGVRP